MHVDAVTLEVAQHELAVIVVADRAEHRAFRAETRRRDHTGRYLTAALPREVAHARAAVRLREYVHIDREIDAGHVVSGNLIFLFHFQTPPNFPLHREKPLGFKRRILPRTKSIAPSLASLSSDMKLPSLFSGFAAAQIEA